MRKNGINLKSVSLMLFVLFAASFVFSCGKKTGGPKDIYFRYYNMADRIVSFQGDVVFLTDNKRDEKAEYSVNFSREKGYDITKRVRGEFTARFTGKDDKLTVDKKKGKVTATEDSVQNRLAAGIPMNLGIDPFYFLETDLEKSRFVEKDKNSLVISYATGGKTVEASITTDGEKITGIAVTLDNVPFYRVTYSGFVKIDRDFYFPTGYVHEIYEDNGRSQSITVSYSIKDIKLAGSL